MRGDGAGVIQDAPPRDLAVFLALLDADEATALLQGSAAGGAAAGEGVKDEVAGSGDEGDEVTHERDGLDGGVDVTGACGEALGALTGRGLGDVEEAGSCSTISKTTFLCFIRRSLSLKNGRF